MWEWEGVEREKGDLGRDCWRNLSRWLKENGRRIGREGRAFFEITATGKSRGQGPTVIF